MVAKHQEWNHFCACFRLKNEARGTKPVEAACWILNHLYNTTHATRVKRQFRDAFMHWSFCRIRLRVATNFQRHTLRERLHEDAASVWWQAISKAI